MISSLLNMHFNHSLTFAMTVAPVPVQAEFDDISLVIIGTRFADDRQACIAWCRQHGLLAIQLPCQNPGCGGVRPCVEQRLNSVIDGVTWRCPTCKYKFSIRYSTSSFFKGSHLELWQILGYTYLWCRSAGRS